MVGASPDWEIMGKELSHVVDPSGFQGHRGSDVTRPFLCGGGKSDRITERASLSSAG